MIRYNPEFREMVTGGVGEFDEIQLQAILQQQNELNINTISVQKSGSLFLCRVDEKTVNNYNGGEV